MRTRALPLLALSVLALGAAGCDAIAEKLGVDKVDVNLGSAGSSLAVSATPSASQASVTRGGSDLPNAFDVESIQFLKENITFTPSATKAAQSGSIDVDLLVNGYPAITGKIIVENNVVTGTQPDVNQVGQFTAAQKTAIRARYNALPSANRPTLNDFEGKTADEIVSLVNSALRSTSFNVSLHVVSTNGINGTLSVNKARFNLDF